MHILRRAKQAVLFGLFLLLQTGAVFANPERWATGLQTAATPIMHNIHSFYYPLLILMVVISLFVLGLLIYVVLRYNAKANPTPSKTTHNTLIEVVWTVIPILIVIAICIPSFRLLYFQREIPKPDLTVKIIGNQWNWSYEYPGHAGVEFTAYMKQDNQLTPTDFRLLSTDNELVVPVGKVVQILVTASDVIHSWTIPSFGIKIDAIPGRLNEDWFRVEKEGTYFGQCSELCGKDHAFMPIAVRVVSQDQFNKWLGTAQSSGVDKANAWLHAEIKGNQSTTGALSQKN